MANRRRLYRKPRLGLSRHQHTRWCYVDTPSKFASHFPPHDQWTQTGAPKPMGDGSMNESKLLEKIEVERTRKAKEFVAVQCLGQSNLSPKRLA